MFKQKKQTKMTSKELLKEIEAWLSFNTEPSREETAKLRKSIKDHLTEQLSTHDVMLCTFCEKEIIEAELTYTEDAEPSHIKCLEDFNKHWGDRAEMMDLMGY